MSEVSHKAIIQQVLSPSPDISLPQRFDRLEGIVLALAEGLDQVIENKATQSPGLLSEIETALKDANVYIRYLEGRLSGSLEGSAERRLRERWSRSLDTLRHSIQKEQTDEN